MKKKKKKNKKKTAAVAPEAPAPEVLNGSHAVKESPVEDDEEEVEAGGDGERPFYIYCKDICLGLLLWTYCPFGSYGPG